MLWVVANKRAGEWREVEMSICSSEPPVRVASTQVWRRAVRKLGPCLGFFSYAILRRHRRKHARPLRAQALGGTPIRPSRRRGLPLGLVMYALSVVLATHGAGAGLVFVRLCWVVAGVGATISVLVLLSVLPAGHLQFDADALVIGTIHDQVRVPWGAITGMAETELHRNPVVLIWMGGPAALSVQPASCRARVLPRMTTSRNWLGADFAITCSQYGIDPPVLPTALERYVSEPRTYRAEPGLQMAQA